MKALKPTFFVAAVQLGLLLQGAQASCNGNACSAYSVEAKSFSSSDKKFRTSLLNKDQNKKIRLKGCMSVPGKFSGYCWEVTIDPGKRLGVENGLGALTKPEEAEKNFIVDITGAEFVQEHVPASGGPASPTPPPSPTKPVDIKLSVVNGESVPLLITLWDVDKNGVIADRTLLNSQPFPVTLNNKEGKGHLRWAVSTIPSGLSTAFLKFAPWDGTFNYTIGANVVLGGKYYRAIKTSQHVTPRIRNTGKRWKRPIGRNQAQNHDAAKETEISRTARG